MTATMTTPITIFFRVVLFGGGVTAGSRSGGVAVGDCLLTCSVVVPMVLVLSVV